jgi:hypothetical protein
MYIPTSRAYKLLRQVVREHLVEHSVVRTTHAAGRFGEDEETESTITVEAWLHQPTEINVDTPYGDRLGGDLEALALPSADVEVGDEYPHGGETYEVQRIQHLPDNDDKKLKRFSLTRKTNDD